MLITSLEKPQSYKSKYMLLHILIFMYQWRRRWEESERPICCDVGVMLWKHLKIKKGVKHPVSYVKATQWTAKKDKSLICTEERLKGLRWIENLWVDYDVSVFQKTPNSLSQNHEWGTFLSVLCLISSVSNTLSYWHEDAWWKYFTEQTCLMGVTQAQNPPHKAE